MLHTTMFTLFVGGSILLLCNLTQTPPYVCGQQQSPVLLSFSPKSGPTMGGTLLSVSGEGFVQTGQSRSKCIFQDPSHGAAISEVNQVYNSTFLTCVLPPITYLPYSVLEGGHLLKLSVTGSMNIRSNDDTFFIFDLSRMKIGNISPNEGLNDTQSLILVQGSGFLDTGAISCSIIADEQALVRATFVSTTLLQCTLPTYPNSARVHVGIFLNGQITASVQAETQDANLFTFFATAPEVVSCQFTLSYALLLLTFDREVEIGGENDCNTTHIPTCNLVFSDETISLLGNDASCLWYNSQQRRVVVILPPTSLVQLNSLLVLRGTNIRTRAVEYSRLASGSVQVDASSEVLKPVPVLEAPDYIPYCGNFIASGENSQHGGSIPLEYRWLISNNFTGTELPTQDPTLRDYIPDDFTNTSVLIIPSDAFMEENIYTLQLMVKNFLGLESTALANISKLNGPAPLVLIYGSPTRKVIVNAEVRLEGVAILPECLNASGLVDYSWKIGSLTGHDEVYLGSINTKSTVLVIPPFMLTPDSVFVAVLTAVIGGKSSNSSLQLMTEFLDITARINGGIHRALGENDTVLLDGSVSKGIDQNVTEITVLWHCTSISDTPSVSLLPCTNSTGLPIQLSNDLVYTIPSSTLRSGWYNFTLTLTYFEVESTAYQTICVLPYNIPHVAVMPPRRQESIVVYRKLILIAAVSSDLPGVVTWSSERVPGYAQVLLSANTTRTPINYEISPTLKVDFSVVAPVLFVSNVTASPFTNIVSLVLKEDMLLPGNPYRFRLEVTNSDGRTGFSEVDIFTESLPLAGHLEIRPSQGQPLVTHFSLRALQWTDDVGNTPLSYQFGFRYPCGGDDSTYWLTGVLTRNRLTAMLPVTNCGSLHVVLRIYDQNEAFVDHVSSVRLDTYNLSTNAGVDLLPASQAIEQQSLLEGNWIEGLANLMSLSVSVNRHPDVFTQVQAFKQQAVDLLLGLYKLSIPVSRSHLNQLLSLLLETSWHTNLSDSTLSEVSSLLESVVSVYNSFSRAAANLEPGFSQTEAGVIFVTYGNLISTSSLREGARVRVDSFTESLLRTTPDLGYGLCLQLGISEEAVFLVTEDFGTLKASYINLPVDYSTIISYANSPFGPTDVIVVDFGSELFQRYLQRQCSGKDSDNTVRGKSNLCSGVCVISAQFKHNLKWQGSEYSSYAKTHFLQLSLADPQNGTVFNVTELPSFPVELSFPITTLPSDYDQLECVLWDNDSTTWNSEGCTTTVLDSTRVVCQCGHLAGGQVTVLERCSSGYYGEMCTEECPQGLWGDECEMSCDCSSRGTCSAHDGSCDCDPGWTGDRCQDVCATGSWGDNCGELCLCENGGDCSPVDGSCECQPGWIGQHCSEACPNGFFGDGCASICECRDVTECDKTAGVCSCHDGYVGPTCHSPCSEGFYGDRCALECGCSENGTEMCDHVNGTCFCREKWEGQLCDTEITPAPSVSSPLPMTSSSSGFQIWWAVIPVVLGVAAAVVIIIALLCWKAKRQKRKKVLPISEEVIGHSEGKERRVKDIIATCSYSEEDFAMTKGESYEVLVPKGAKLKDMFVKHGRDGQEGFKEPPVLNGRQRWQIIKLLSKDIDDQSVQKGKEVDRSTSASKVTFKLGESQPEVLQASSTSALNPDEEEDGDGEGELARQRSSSTGQGSMEKVTEMTYQCGVYLDTDATLKDLRNAFLDSNQLDTGDRFFRFLQSDIPGDCIDIEMEDEVMLAQIEGRLVQPWTLYIEALEGGSVTLELCVCGKFADLECTDCESRGYCSGRCQMNDWHRHELVCRVMSAKRSKKNRRKKKHKKGKEERRSSSRKASRVRNKSTPASDDNCICGKSAEFECSGCAKQGYCCKECQSEDWSFHQYYCEAEPEIIKDPADLNKRGKLEAITESPREERAADNHSTTSVEGTAVEPPIQDISPVVKLKPSLWQRPEVSLPEAWTEERLRSKVEWDTAAREREELEKRIAESGRKDE